MGKTFKEMYPELCCTEYRSWSAMKQRCLNPKYHAYDTYGGRGVTICKDWIESYSNFLKDMGRKPSKDHTLDRVNQSMIYSKDTCRWATKTEQTQNRRSLSKKSNFPMGVHREKGQKKYRSRIMIEKIDYNLGTFDTPEDAHQAYSTMYIEWYGVKPPLGN